MEIETALAKAASRCDDNESVDGSVVSTIKNTFLTDEYDPDDMVYTGPSRRCGGCDSFTNGMNPFFKMLKKPFESHPKLRFRKFRVWARYTKAGNPETRTCLLCHFFAYYGHRSSGGVKYLATVVAGGKAKQQFQLSLNTFIERALAGKITVLSDVAHIVE